MTLGPDPRWNESVSKVVVQVVDTPELSIPLLFNWNLATHQNWVGDQQVAQRVHL